MKKKEDFLIESTKTTPLMTYEADANHMKLVGRSLPEDAVGTYARVLKWFKQFRGQLGPRFELTIMLEYINSTSLKELSTMFMALDEEAKEGTEVVVHWYYEEFDDDLKDTGMDLGDLFYRLRFEMVAIPDDDEDDMITRSKLLLRKLP
jgi:hypothetical protein